jgi:hypothetical protein
MTDVRGKSVHARWYGFGIFALLLAAVVFTGCDFPRDPRGTLDQVQSGSMRVGIVANEPWTRIEDALEQAHDLDWRIQDLAIMPVRRLKGRG